jgi:hypothetical protein
MTDPTHDDTDEGFCFWTRGELVRLALIAGLLAAPLVATTGTGAETTTVALAGGLMSTHQPDADEPGPRARFESPGRLRAIRVMPMTSAALMRLEVADREDTASPDIEAAELAALDRSFQTAR